MAQVRGSVRIICLVLLFGFCSFAADAWALTYGQCCEKDADKTNESAIAKLIADESKLTYLHFMQMSDSEFATIIANEGSICSMITCLSIDKTVASNLLRKADADRKVRDDKSQNSSTYWLSFAGVAIAAGGLLLTFLNPKKQFSSGES